MKLIFLLFAVIGLSYSAPAPRSLRTDIDEFLALIPVDQIKGIYHKYENDPDIVKVVAYLKSDDFAKVAHIVAGVDEVKDLVNYLESKDIHVIDLLNKIADLLGLPHWPGSFISLDIPHQSRTWRDFIDEVKAALPMDDIVNLFVDKLANSADFQELYEKIASADYQHLHDEALKHPEIVDMIKRLNAMGVDTKAIWEKIKEIFGWEYRGKRSSRSLRDDIDEFLALIPVDKIKAIYHKYENDPDIVKVVAYLKSKDFAAVAHIVAGVAEVKDLVNYLESKNIHVIDLLNKIADLLGLPHWPGSFISLDIPHQSRTWRDFIDEVKAALPMDDIVNLFVDKLANSADFQELYEKIASTDYQHLHDEALKHPEIVDMLKRLNAMGVDTKAIWEKIKVIFGWEYRGKRSSRSLRDDIDEFLALIPVDKIKAIYHKYENDPDIVKVVAYLKSKDFAAVAHIVAGVAEVKDLVNYLESKNIHVIDLLNKIADLLGLPHWPGSFISLDIPHQSRTWRDFIDEVKAALPMDDIVNLFVDKLANSADFQELYEKIASADYQHLHDEALKHPEIVDMIQRLNAMGVDTKAIWEKIKEIFGWEYRGKRSSRSLRDDIDEFLALIPVDKIKAIYHKYENDPDIVKVVAYLKSKDFAAVAHIVAGVAEVKDLVNYLESKNIHVIDLLNKIADLLGLPHWPGSFISLDIPHQSRTWRQFIDEVKAALPMDDIVNLFVDKLANSADFQELYEKIASSDYQHLHDEALKHPEIVDMIKRLNAMGVDTKAIWEKIKEIFGWEYRGKRSSRSLRDDIDEFLALIPVDKIKAIYHKYENDPDIVKVVAYLKSKDFAAVAHIVAGVAEVKDLVNYLESKNIHVIDLLNKIADLLGLPHWPGSFISLDIPHQSRTWRDFIDEVKAALPMDDIVNLFVDKLANSADFQELYEKIASSDYQHLHDEALKHPEIVDMLNRLNAMGVDTKAIWEKIKEIFGWEYRGKRSSRSLRDDIDEFLALIPVDKIKAIYHKYENDPDIVKVVAYLKSKDFAAVAHIVAGVAEVKDLVNYLESKNIHVIDLLNKIADLLGLPHWPGSFISLDIPHQSRTWRQFIDEVKAALPMDDIVNLFVDKLANSADFQELYEKIASSDYQHLHDEALKHPEIVDMLNRLNAMGVDTKAIWEKIKEIFGWEYRGKRSSRSLRDDIDEFLALIPVDKIKAIYHKYENDPDIVKVVAYLKSEDFAAVVRIIEDVAEVKDLVNYLESKNIHVIDLLNKIADLLGLPHWPGSLRPIAVPYPSRTWRDFIDEVKAALPIDDIVNLFVDKLANSADFQELYEKIASANYQHLHDEALKHPEIVDMLNRLNAMGVDTKAIWEKIKEIFGWEYRRSTRSLRDDFDDFEALIPVDKIMAIHKKYANDPEFLAVSAYLRGPEFRKVAHIVAGVKEIQDLVNYLESKNIHAIAFINNIADRLGLPHWPGSFMAQPYPFQSRTFKQFVDEINAALPLEDIQNLFVDKLANSADFQDLYEKIASSDYQHLHDEALKHPEIVDMLHKLNDLGFDMKAIWEKIKEIFGWE